MLIHSMSVSADGFVTDRDGSFMWTVPSDAQLGVHTEQVRELGGYLLGRRLYEVMLPWETDPAMRGTERGAEFADIWCALPKVVFSRTLERVEGNARLAEAPLAEEVAAALASTSRDVSIGGTDLAGQAVALGLLGEFRLFRYPVLLGGGTPYFPLLPAPLELELVEARATDARVVYERYRVAAGADEPR